VPSWTLSLEPTDAALPAVDVVVDAAATATVADLADALGRHLHPGQSRAFVVPTESGTPMPPDRPLAECPWQHGDLVTVTAVPATWRERAGARPRARGVLRVIAGPDTGRRCVVRAATATVGRGPESTLRLTDPTVSTTHARLSFGTATTLVDAGSANGTTVDDVRAERATEVSWGSTISVGETRLVLEPPPAESTADAVTVTGATTPVLRPPRFGAPLEEGELDLAAPPTRQRPSPLPWAMIAMPMVMGLALLATTRSPFTLVYLLGWPVIGLAGWWQQRRIAARDFAAELGAWHEELHEVLSRLDAQTAAQRARAEEDHPDPAEVRHRIAARDPHLWSVRRDTPEFLGVRVGRGDVAARLTAAVADGGDRQELRTARARIGERAVLRHLPIVADLGAHTVVAITGPDARVDDCLRALLLRLAHAHSPADVEVAAVLGAARAGHESWLRWLPHTATRIGDESPVAVGPRQGQALLERLVAADGRQSHAVCLVDEAAGVPRRAIEAVAAAARHDDERPRVHLVWLGGSAAAIPAATELLLDLDAAGPGAVLGERDRAARRIVDTVDTVDLAEAWRSARTMSGYVDEVALLPPDTALPATVRLPETVPGLPDLDDPTAVRRRWATRAGLRATLGVGPDGPVTIDLREDGPHGLVAGTTGSGKSELLQALLCSLALENPPERVTFLLVDYKGGAAFRECADLPHTVGYITDLTPALVDRALTSLGAEIHRRELLLAEHEAKDLRQLEELAPDAAPPSLLICVDEFAALTSEVPDFVDGMVDIAQRGRSLGMHMLLATQRPAGVVTAAIRANTDLRIALRVGATDDSIDVIDSPDAARISRRTPGRAWIRRTGHGTSELVQTTWVGAREELRAERGAVDVRPFTLLPAGPSYAPAGAEHRATHPQTDLDRCVATIRRAFADTGRESPRRPWLPALPEELALAVGEDRVAGIPGRVRLGLVDLPAEQRQPALELDYAEVGHVLVHGASGSGKTELLRSVAVAASLDDTTGAGVAPYIYALDFAGGGLSGLSTLPTTASVIGESQHGQVLRLIRLLRSTVTERAASLAAYGVADVDALAAAGHRLPRVHVLIDNLPALVEHLESAGGSARDHLDHLGTVLGTGRRVGVHVTASAPGRTGVPTALGAAFGRRIVLRMTTADDYLMLGVPGNVLAADTPPGRGLVGRSSVQVGFLGRPGSTEQAARLATATERLATAVADRPGAPVLPFPDRLPAHVLPAPEGSTIAIGVDADAIAPVFVDLVAGPVLVSGPAGSGRTSLLDGIVDLAARSSTPPLRVLRAGGGTTSAPADLLAALGDRDPETGWSLVVIDDAEAWEDAAGTPEVLTRLTDRLLAPGSGAGPGDHRYAVVLAAETRAVRSRVAPGLVTAVRGRRRGVLLRPDWADGDLFGIAVPTRSVEPLTGRGRGLWCENGASILLQAVSCAPHDLMQDTDGGAS